mgnify:CR=1 FL=1
MSQAGEFYPELMRENENIRREFNLEREKFVRTIEQGLQKFHSIIDKKMFGGNTSAPFNIISGKEAFNLFQTYGLTEEIISEVLAQYGKGYNKEEFNKEFQKHQEISRAGVEKKFGGHGLILDTGELKAGSAEELKIVTRLHTATHLLNSALHQVLGDEVSQRGSDISTERTRFDFVFPRKMTPEEIKRTENIVNEAVAKDYPVTEKEMPLEEAKKSGAMFFYKGKCPDMVKVYSIGPSTGSGNNDLGHPFSQELCGGPHVAHTWEIGHFKITKEESSSAGIRRIRAVISK